MPCHIQRIEGIHRTAYQGAILGKRTRVRGWFQALGNLAALSPGPTVRLLAVRACKRYTTCTGNSFDPEAQKVAAAVVRAIVVKASAHMKQGGEKDVWRTVVLPTAFLGRKDENTKIAELWDDVWKEAGHSVTDGASGRESFGTLLEEQLLPEVVSGIIAALQEVAWSRRVAAASAISELSSLGVLSPLRQHTIDGVKAATERYNQRNSATKRILEQCVGLLKKQRIWTGKSKVLKA
jgi:hypothetical protein